MLRPLWIALALWILPFPAFLFKACVEELPAQHGQTSPGWFSTTFDPYWRNLSYWVFPLIRKERESLLSQLLKEKKALSAEVDFLEERDEETQVRGKYGLLPTVYIDPPESAYFPVPVSKPLRWSWFHTLLVEGAILKNLRTLSRDMTGATSLQKNDRIKKLISHAAQWNEIGSRLVFVSQEIRYLENWMAPLLHREKQKGAPPSPHVLISTLFNKTPESPTALESLHDLLRPRQVVFRHYLVRPPSGLVTLPIATDVLDQRFLREIEGALQTH